MNMREFSELERRYAAFRARGLSLDLSRGKPERKQLDLSLPMLDPALLGDFTCEDGMDARNYGDPTGIPEAKRLFGALLGMPEEQVIVGGNSSIHLIYDALTRALLHGPLPGDAPWKDLPSVKFLCPAPGYDWHFHMLSMLGIGCVPVRMLENGPDMDEVERLARDPAVKGIVCVPMYSNPTGVTFSDDAVDRLARMETAASDFRILWDNAYCVHHLYPDDRERLKNLYGACVAAGTGDRALLFTSTSKITFAGGGVGAMAASPRNIERQAALQRYQMVCYDKVNQLRHARFFPDLGAVERHMEQHAAILRPKFELVERVLAGELEGVGSFRAPKGGYFLCYHAPRG
ncbi:MAG: aminotransferase class I/II-fold pyridoxal phosphate-dependent enzyme, partial [Clostridiales bacterium]|nr:aminotransferase class I/II-fold pyridoxal phosphate-dependent enzyme [Clostridiales bacterium]